MTWYVETEDGDPVSGEIVEAIRLSARTIWQTLVSRNIAPTNWADATLEAHNYYEHHLCRRFPQLSYGANNWKAHMIATENYPSWYNKHVGRPAKVKNEPIAMCALKRSPSPSNLAPSSKEHKKAKVGTPLTDSTPKSQEIVNDAKKADPFIVCALLTCFRPSLIHPPI